MGVLEDLFNIGNNYVFLINYQVFCNMIAYVTHEKDHPLESQHIYYHHHTPLTS